MIRIINQCLILVLATAVCVLCTAVVYGKNSPCIANYSVDGEWSTGKTFRSWIEIPDADESRAFNAIGRFIATEGNLLGLSTNKEIGVITAYQEDFGKRSPLSVTFSKTKDGFVRVEVATRLAPGLRAPTIRAWLCKLLDEALPAGQRASSQADRASGIMLRTSSGDVPLSVTVGKIRKAGFGPVLLFFCDLPGAQALVRTAEKQLNLLVSASVDPSNGYLLVRFESDAIEKMRTVKMGSMGDLLKIGVTGKGDLAPDKDWTVPFSTSQESPGVWIVTPEAPLKAGEYGLWNVDEYGVASFGIN